MMKKLVLFFSLFAFVLLFAPQGKAQKQNPAGFVTVEVEDFEEQIHSPNVILVDVRTAKEFEEDHIEGAVNIEWGSNFNYYLSRAKLPKGAKLAVYCRSGRRSKEAAKVLVKKGFTVVELNTGINGWKQAAKPVVHSWGRKG